MSLAPEQRRQSILRDAAEAWLARLRILLLRLAGVATAVFVEPWTAVADVLKTVLTKMSEMSRDRTAAVPESSAMRRLPHVLNAATNLLGICFVIIGGLKLTNSDSKTWSDEIAWCAAFFLIVSIALSYFGISNAAEREWHVRFADWSFLIGIGSLIVAMVIAAYQL